MPQRRELAQAQSLPRATLLEQRTGDGEDGMSCTAGQHSLKVLLYPTVWHLQVVFALVGGRWGLWNELGKCWGNAAEKFRLKPNLTPSSFLGGGEKAREI